MPANLDSMLRPFKKPFAGFSTTLRTSAKLRLGISLLLLLIGIAVFEPYLNDYRLGGTNPVSLGRFNRLLPPSVEHPLGTDHFGRDVLSLQILGLKWSLMIGMLTGSVATIVAVIIATVAGYLGGRVDGILNALTNSVLVVPTLPIYLLIALWRWEVDLVLLCLLLSVFAWPATARILRAQILSLSKRPFVELAKVTGLNSAEIMIQEVLPNVFPYVGVGFSLSTITAMLTETTLRVVGIGPSELQSLGLLLQWALNSGAMSQGYYTIVLSPIILLILIFASLNLVNVGLEEVFNPRLKKIAGT